MDHKMGLLAHVISSGLGLLSRTRLPKLDGVLHMAGLNFPVKVIRDKWGVPHITARNHHDLFFAQGFIHAQDRLWQIEFNRRMVAGRLSEILGEVALPLDKWMRTLTMRRVAEFEAGNQDEETRAHLQAYANGINAHLARGRLPVEFALLRFRPEPWVVADSLAWIKMMGWTLSVNWEAELLRSQLIGRLGPELASEIEVFHLQRWPYVIPPGLDFSHIGSSALERSRLARMYTGPSPYEGLGSNNWVIGGERTTTGAPILANDMHLGLTNPAIWYENHLICPEFNAIGVSFPGLPGVIAGHNGHVAWGFTNGFPDVQDLYIERVRRTPEGVVQVEYNGVWEEARVFTETIRVKGGQSATEEIIITRHGPIINDLAPDFTGEAPLALRWTALEPDQILSGLFQMQTARNCEEFRDALRHWTTPVQNVVFADTSGMIAYLFPGKIPVRARGNGRVPVPGWTSEYEWIGYIAFDDLPYITNPPQQYLASANNRCIPDDYPIRLDLEPISGDRAQRISEMILDSSMRGGQEKIDIGHFKIMQFDQISPSARIIVRTVSQLNLGESVHIPQTELHTAIKLFKDWDGTLSATSPAAALYQVFIREIVRIIVSARLDPPSPTVHKQPTRSEGITLTDRYMGKGPTPVLADISLFSEFWLPWLTKLFSDPDSHWFDLGNQERRDDVIILALQASVKELTARLGSDTQKWSWGKLHQVTFQHVLGAKPLLEHVFNLGPFPVGGDHTTIWATGASYHNLDTSRMIGPPYRMIIDLGNLDQSISILAPGQSGHLASPHYRDQLKAWFNRGYHPMLYTENAIKEHALHRLSLNP